MLMTQTDMQNLVKLVRNIVKEELKSQESDKPKAPTRRKEAPKNAKLQATQSPKA